MLRLFAKTSCYVRFAYRGVDQILISAFIERELSRHSKAPPVKPTCPQLTQISPIRKLARSRRKFCLVVNLCSIRLVSKLVAALLRCVLAEFLCPHSISDISDSTNNTC